MYVYGVSSLPSLAKSPSAGKKTHTKRKVIVVLYLGNLLKKNPSQQQVTERKNLFVQDSWVLEHRASVLFNSVCHVFSVFPCPSHQDAAYLACGMQEGDLSHRLLQIRPLHSCLHFKALDFCRVLSYSFHWGQYTCQRPQTLTVFQRAKGAYTET